MRTKDGPGLFWQFLEFMGMTWPGHKKPPPDPYVGAPRCASCGNPMDRDGDRWCCPHHPSAAPMS